MEGWKEERKRNKNEVEERLIQIPCFLKPDFLFLLQNLITQKDLFALTFAQKNTKKYQIKQTISCFVINYEHYVLRLFTYCYLIYKCFCDINTFNKTTLTNIYLTMPIKLSDKL